VSRFISGLGWQFFLKEHAFMAHDLFEKTDLLIVAPQ
jgi:hypothetical protein